MEIPAQEAARTGSNVALTVVDAKDDLAGNFALWVVRNTDPRRRNLVL